MENTTSGVVIHDRMIKGRANGGEERKGGVIMFGEFIKTRRIAKEISLRRFCLLIDVDASNWSKVERGKLTPPQDDEKLSVIAKVLDIGKNTDAWQEMVDLSRIGARLLPEDIVSDSRMLNTLPVFFRTVRSDKPTTEEIERLLELLKKEA